LSQLWSYLPSDSPRKFKWVKSLPSERRILEKKGEQGLKTKRGETSVEKLHVLRKEKKERIKFTCCWERLSKERKKGDHNFL
jgi:hypothetical protein